MNARMEQLTLDIYDDVDLGKNLRKFASALPADVREAQLPSVEERGALEDDQFALSIITKTASKLNKFPIDSRVSTELSNRYFDLNHQKLPAEAQKIAAAHISKACEKFDLRPAESVKIAASGMAPLTNLFVESARSEVGKRLVKEASTISHYALKGKYPLEDAVSVERAQTYFEKFATQFAPEDRHEYARNVYDRAKTLNIPIQSSLLKKYAGLSYNQDLNAHLKIRENLLEESSKFRPALQKLASFQSTTDPCTFAKVLGTVDERAGLTKYYGRALSDPYSATFGLEKKSSYVYDKDGIYLTDKDIQNAVKDKKAVLETYLGKTLADGLAADGISSFLALPTDAKDLIARIANGEIQ